MTDKIAIERKILEHAVVALEYAYSADDEMVQESIKYLRAALAQKAEPDGQEVALQEIAEFGQDQLREPRTQEEKEQYAFEDWLASECPSGDVESVQRQWEESAEYLDLQDDTPAQPAEPVQRLSDERAAFEAWHNEYRTQELVRRDDTYYNTHVRCRWEGWQARAIESALQPGWRDIESAPKDGSTVIVGRDMGHFGFIRGYARWECSIDGLVPGWISCGFDPVNSNLGLAHPTHWQPIPPAPKATK